MENITYQSEQAVKGAISVLDALYNSDIKLIDWNGDYSWIEIELPDGTRFAADLNRVTKRINSEIAKANAEV